MKSVSGKKFCKVLERHGWSLKSPESSHCKYVKAGYHSVIVPMHGNKDLKTGLLATLLKDTGLTEADL